MQSIGQNIAAKAIAHLGAREEPMGSNSGPEVSMWLRAVGCAPGNPWCAAFASFVVRSVREEMAGNWPIPQSASSEAICSWGEEHNAGVSGRDVTTGCLGLEIGGPVGHHHTLIAVGGPYWDVATEAMMIDTVGGNEGDGVRRYPVTLDGFDWVRPFPDS